MVNNVKKSTPVSPHVNHKVEKLGDLVQDSLAEWRTVWRSKPTTPRPVTSTGSPLRLLTYVVVKKVSQSAGSKASLALQTYCGGEGLPERCVKGVFRSQPAC